MMTPDEEIRVGDFVTAWGLVPLNYVESEPYSMPFGMSSGTDLQVDGVVTKVDGNLIFIKPAMSIGTTLDLVFHYRQVERTSLIGTRQENGFYEIKTKYGGLS